ncbi:MAG TPA: AMP-binding protein, partial [Candidatus Nanopelagicales bacterium]|nr:AMP-binding protein [Candidatus Nanopelagicales bacterium]
APAAVDSSTGALILGGEALTEAVLAPLRERAPHLRIFNEYGPTEAVVGAALHEGWTDLPLSGSLPIGHPAQDTLLYVLDERMHLLPPGVIGELYIGGVGVARGYNGAPAMTAQRFVPNPFAGRSPGALAGSRLYRTGDRARVLQDGTLEFLGRRDDQVKIRGFRIELGEIAAVTRQQPRVQHAIAVVRGEQIVAYVGTDAAGSADEAALRAALRERLKENLPAYMVPSEIVLLRSLPLTANGKIATSELPEPVRSNPEADDAGRAPRNELEERIAAVWCELLRLSRVGIHQNFFDLGGHSLLVVRMHRRLVEMSGRSFSVIEVFRHPTVASLATLLGAPPEAQGPIGDRDNTEDRALARRRALQSQGERARRERS